MFFILVHLDAAGTHDLHLAMTTLHSLQNLRKPQTLSTPESSTGGARTAGSADNRKSSTANVITEVRVPMYDKALRNGRGDRLPRGQWVVVTGETYL